MTATTLPSPGLMRRAASWCYLHPRTTLLLWLALPLGWFGVLYLGSLATLLAQSFYTFDDFTMSVLPDWTLDNYRQLLNPGNVDIVVRTVTMAAAVTVADALMAFPIALYMALYASPRIKALFYIGVMLPMWASYIVKAYAWSVILAKGGLLQWLLHQLGLQPLLDLLLTTPIGGNTLATSHLGRFLVFSYIWLPFMILPIQAALERISPSLLQAASDLGARPRQVLTTVLLPLAFPGVVAGSIFTFCLTLGDYIIPTLIGPSGLFIGTMVYTQQGAVGNMPLAAAFTLVPLLIILFYLWFAKRLGAFNAL
jgi:putative spermidine/putrescine transport system permease protein